MGIEQRRQNRLAVSMTALVKGVDRAGQPFDISTSSENISRGGLSLVTKRDVAEGTELDITITRPPLGPREQAPFFTTGKVVRVIKQDDEFLLAVQFTGPQFRTFVKES